MIVFLMYIRTAWNDYFTGSPTSTLSNEYRTQQTSSDTSVYLLNCFFRSITSSSDGGALYCSTSVSYLLVESTSFLSCKTSADDGGAIFFYNTGSGQCVLNWVCGYDCCSTYTGTVSSLGQFSRIEMNNVATSKNYVNYSSIVRCVKDNSNAYCTIRQYYGKICYPSVNVSMNKCYHRTFLCCPSTDSNSVTCSFSYSSFTDNIATSHACIWFNTGGARYEIKSCNIIRNTITSASYGTIRSDGNLMITDSCILENSANYNFYASSSYIITLSGCTVDSTSKYGSLITQNTVTKSFILALNHISTRNCHSEYDSAGYITPIIQTPTSSKKQIHLCTCGYLFYLPQEGNFVPLASILIFNFIHPHVSGDPLY
jgi:hypothetical protein